MKTKIVSLALALVLTLALVPMMSNPAIAAPTQFNPTIASGSSHRLFVKEDGSLWAFGENSAGQLGDGTLEDRGTPVKVMDDVASVYASGNTSFAIKTNGELWGWGNNQRDALSDAAPRSGSEAAKKQYKIMDGVTSLARSINTYAVKSDGTLWVWGHNIEQMTFAGDTANNRKPVQIMTGVAQVAAANDTANDMVIVLKTDGTMWSFGDYSYEKKTYPEYSGGEALGISEGVGPTHQNPHMVTNEVTLISATYGGTLFINSDNALMAMGKNYDYVLGIGVQGSGGYPEPTKILDNAAWVSANLTAAITNDGDLYAWGYSNGLYAACGVTLKDSERTAPVKMTSGVALVANGMILKQDGTLTTYGSRTIGDVTGVKLPTAGTTTPPVEQPPVDPNTPSPWAEAPIASAIAKGFVPADLQTGYKNTITRLDFCRLAVKYMEYAMGKTIDDILTEKGLQRDNNAFIDVTNSDVLAAYALGITSGAGAGIFNPNGQFTRESAAGMIMNLHRAMGKDVSNPPPSGFADAASISSWTKAGVDYCASVGIMSGGTGNMFNPKNLFTREMSIMLFDNMG